MARRMGPGDRRQTTSAAAAPGPAQSAARAVTRTMTYNQLTSCPDMEQAFVGIYDAVKPFTMTSLERIYALHQAVSYVVHNHVAGDIVECGVWKGGSAMTAALTLKQFGDTARKIWLYDTFEGMTPPGRRDVDWSGAAAQEHLTLKNITADQWCRSELEEVKANMASTGYPARKLVYVRGRVEQMIPKRIPEKIAVLRLDTDWFESTWHELVHLFPRLVRGGVLIVDDYGHWQGCREAVDRYFAEHGVKMLLGRVDYTGRMGVKI